MDKSAVGTNVSVSVTESGPFGSVTPAGAATVAVLTTVPVAPGATLAVKLNAATPPGNRSTVALILPMPTGASQFEPAVATQVHVALVKLAGKTSVTRALLTALGPTSVTVMA